MFLDKDKIFLENSCVSCSLTRLVLPQKAIQLLVGVWWADLMVIFTLRRGGGKGQH